eukprot:3713595-Prymnesium_polylepis.1
MLQVTLHASQLNAREEVENVLLEVSEASPSALEEESLELDDVTSLGCMPLAISTRHLYDRPAAAIAAVSEMVAGAVASAMEAAAT